MTKYFIDQRTLESVRSSLIFMGALFLFSLNQAVAADPPMKGYCTCFGVDEKGQPNPPPDGKCEFPLDGVPSCSSVDGASEGKALKDSCAQVKCNVTNARATAGVAPLALYPGELGMQGEALVCTPEAGKLQPCRFNAKCKLKKDSACEKKKCPSGQQAVSFPEDECPTVSADGDCPRDNTCKWYCFRPGAEEGEIHAAACENVAG